MRRNSLENCILSCNFTLRDPNGGLAGFPNGTLEVQGNAGDELTLGKQRCKNTPFGRGLTKGLPRQLDFISSTLQNRLLANLIFFAGTLKGRPSVQQTLTLKLNWNIGLLHHGSFLHKHWVRRMGSGLLAEPLPRIRSYLSDEERKSIS